MEITWQSVITYLQLNADKIILYLINAIFSALVLYYRSKINSAKTMITSIAKEETDYVKGTDKKLRDDVNKTREELEQELGATKEELLVEMAKLQKEHNEAMALCKTYSDYCHKLEQALLVSLEVEPEVTK